MNLELQTLKKKDFVLDYTLDAFLDSNDFILALSQKILFNNIYTILIRVSYWNPKDGSFREYKMLGNSLTLCVESNSDLEIYVLDDCKDNSKYLENKENKENKGLHDVIIDRLKKSMDDYGYTGYSQVNIQILGYIHGEKRISRTIKFNPNTMGEHKDLYNLSEIKRRLDVIPLLPTIEDLGNKLDKYISDNILYINLKDNNININEYLSKYNEITSYDFNTDFFIKLYNDKEYIITLNIIDDDNKKSISLYNIEGMFIDKIIHNNTDNTHTRNSGNIKLYIDNKGIYKKDLVIPLESVKSKKLTGRLSKIDSPEWKIGTLDLETYRDGSMSYTYAIGFYIKDDLNTFYIGEDFDSDKLILECIDKMLTSKYHDYTFYVHNFLGFDSYYIYRVIKSLPNKYKVKEIFKDAELIFLEISTNNKDILTEITNKKGINKKKVIQKKKNYTIKIADSYTLLSYRLYDLSRYFNNNELKSFFPYDFVNKNTLLYLGDKPNKNYYSINSKDQIEIDDFNNFYSSINNTNWSLKSETIKYLEKDLISLFEVMSKFIYKIKINYNVHVTKSLTISSLAMKIYLKRYYNNNIPLIKTKSIYNNIKESYYGGITEVYKPYDKNLYYYDVNSLYPFAALNPMPGLNCIYTDNINKNISEIIDDIFGFYYCRVETSNKYIGLLPVRLSSGLVMPLGTFEGWYFSEELKYAYNNGYNITVIKGYKFDKVDNVFDKYVKSLYEIKSTTNDKVEKTIVKSLLNNLIGRFGLDINKYKTSVVSDEDFRYICKTRNIKNFKEMGSEKIVSYYTEISKEICESHNLDYQEELMKISDFNFSKENNYSDVSIAIASAVTSYARIYMNKIKLDILNKGGLIYYTDTDSIVTNIKLDDNLVGSGLGQFKLEYEILEGYFLSSKTYGIIINSLDKNGKNKIVLKNKGSNTDLCYENFIDVYNGTKVDLGKYVTKKNIVSGFVTIKNYEQFSMSPNSYTKRIKKYDSNNKWIDTKPMTLLHSGYNVNLNNLYKVISTYSSLLLNKIKIYYIYFRDTKNINKSYHNIIYNIKYINKWYIFTIRHCVELYRSKKRLFIIKWYRKLCSIYYIKRYLYYTKKIRIYFVVVKKFCMWIKYLINILINLIILFLFTVIIIIISTSPNTILYDSSIAEVHSSICSDNTTDLLHNVNNIVDIEKNSSMLRKLFKDYINLFKKELLLDKSKYCLLINDIKIYSLLDYLVNKNLLGSSDINNLNIISEISNQYIKDLEGKIYILEKKISIMKIEFLNTRIKNMDLKYEIIDLVKDLSKQLDIKVNNNITLYSPYIEPETPLLRTPRLGLGLNIFNK